MIFLRIKIRLSVNNSDIVLYYRKNFPMLLRKLLMPINPNSLSKGTKSGYQWGLTLSLNLIKSDNIECKF